MKIRPVSDVLAEIRQTFQRKGVVCVGFRINCRTDKSIMQMQWGDVRGRIPRRKVKLPHIPLWFNQWHRIENGKHYFYTPQNDRYGPFKHKVAAWKACQRLKRSNSDL